MKKLFLFCLLLPAAALGDDPLACVDARYIDAFLGNSRLGQPIYSTELPYDFPVLRVPSGTSLVGSEVNQVVTSVVFTSEMSTNASLKAFVDQMTSDEWRDVSIYMHNTRGGFQTRVVSETTTLCRDAQPGALYAKSREVNGRVYVELSLTSRNRELTCSDLLEHSEYREQTHLYDSNVLPVLFLPDNAQSSGGGSGGGGEEYHSHVIVSTNMSRESLVSFLGDQIRDQGWTFDSGWSGSQSSGSVWSKSTADFGEIIGSLHAYGEAHDSYRVRFTALLAITRR